MAEIVTEDRRSLEPRAAPGTGRSRQVGNAARFVNAVVGAWVFLSAFLLPQSAPSRTNTWVCGLLVVLFALIAMRAPAARFVNTAIALWLFITAFSLPAVSEASVWSNWISGVVIFFVSLMPGGYVSRPHQGMRRPVQA